MQSIATTEQLELLFDDKRWPKKPYCADWLDYGLKIRSLSAASKKRYIQHNPPNLVVTMVHDVDRENAAIAWEDADLPPPTWIAKNRENGHAHIAYSLRAPVLMESFGGKRDPLRLLCAIEAGFREKLKADQGYSGLITKNPRNRDWDVLWGPPLSFLYDLGDLAEYVDLTRHVKKKPEELGWGRNVSLFDWLRHYAYRAIKTHNNFVIWQSHLNAKAIERNAEFSYPLDGKEVWHIVKSVSKWVWYKFDLKKSDENFSKLQAHRGSNGGKASGIARLASSEEQRATARLMAAQGTSKSEIARVLQVPRPTIILWLKS